MHNICTIYAQYMHKNSINSSQHLLQGDRLVVGDLLVDLVVRDVADLQHVALAGAVELAQVVAVDSLVEY